MVSKLVDRAKARSGVLAEKWLPPYSEAVPVLMVDLGSFEAPSAPSLSVTAR